MKTKWAMLRLDQATHTRLVAFLKGWKTWKKRLANGRRFKLWQQPSLSDAVGELLDRVDAHKRRSKRSSRKQPATGARQSGPELVELPGGIAHFPNAAQLVELELDQAGDDVLDMEAG